MRQLEGQLLGGIAIHLLRLEESEKVHILMMEVSQRMMIQMVIAHTQTENHLVRKSLSRRDWTPLTETMTIVVKEMRMTETMTNAEYISS